MKIDRDWLRSVAEPVILKLVTDRPMYGYEIIQVVKDRSGDKVNFQEGTLYPCLHRLESQGMISSEWVTPEGGRKRKYYSITPKGQKRLESKMVEWRQFTSAMDSIFTSYANILSAAPLRGIL